MDDESNDIRFESLHKGKRVNKPVFNRIILFSIMQLVIKLTTAITYAYYSAWTWYIAQWIHQVIGSTRWRLVFGGRTNTLEDMKRKEKDVKNVPLNEKKGM